MYELRHLEIFAEAARCGSFTQASANLRLSVAAVSRAIARLEQELDCRLFNRTTRQLNLTSDGKLFLAEVSAGMERLINAKHLLHEQQGRVSGTLKVLLPNSFCKHYMMPELPGFLARQPELHLDIHVEDFGTDLLAGGFEVAVQFGNPPINGYISRGLGHMEIVLLASPTYLARRGVPRTVADLARHEQINLRGSSGAAPYPWRLEHRSGNKGLNVQHQPAGRYFFNTQLDAVIHAALCGVGIVPSDVRAVERYLRSGDLKVVLPEYKITFGSELFLLYPHRDHLPMKARTFIDFLVDVAGRRMAVEGFDPYAYAA